MFLLFRQFEDFFHLSGLHDLIIRAKPEGFMQGIGKIGSGVGGDVTLFIDLEEVHLS